MNPITMTAWISLFRASERATDQIEMRLKHENLPPLGWYDALLEIEKSGDSGLRPYQLHDKLLMPQYGTSRLLARIEKAGYIQRVPCKQDGRGHVMKITKEGSAIRMRMWPVYALGIRSVIETRLSPSECETLQSLLSKVATKEPI